MFLLLGLTACLDNQTVSIEDEGLKEAVFQALNLKGDTLTRVDAKKLTSLNASNKGITSLTGIDAFVNLKELILEDNFVSDVSPLATLTKLEVLSLRNNEIVSLEGINFHTITHLPLRVLSLRHNVYRPDPNNRNIQIRLTNISLLGSFTSLEELELRDNTISSIASLTSLEHLTMLDISQNPITSLEPLSSLSKLTHLNLREAQVSSIEPLLGLTELVYLNLHSNNQLLFLEPISNLTKLETLILANVPVGNQIEVLRGLNRLVRLNLENTQVSDIRVLAKLMEDGALQDNSDVFAEVNIASNPIPLVSEESEYGYNSLRPYWHNITLRTPVVLPLSPTQEVFINEVMSSNGNSIKDSDHDRSDWIELYNPNDDPISLGQYYLSDNEANPLKWRFPANATIGPKGFLVVFASGKDKQVGTSEFHTNFSLSIEGEPVLLTHPDGVTLIDQLPAVIIPRDMSYGRSTDGGDTWVFYDHENVSPGSSNNTKTPFDLENAELPIAIPYNIEPFERLFNDEIAKSFTVQITSAEWHLYDQVMLAYASRFNGELRSDHYARVNLVYEDEIGSVDIPNVGFRTRGNLSRVRIQNNDGSLNLSHFKFSFKEHFNDPSLSNQRNRNVFELEELDLKFNRNGDSTYLTEKYAMDLFNAYDVLSANTTLAKLYIEIDGIKHFYGIYTLFEPIDQNFLNRRFNEEQAKGNLYKSLWQQYGPAALHYPVQNGAIGIKDVDNNYRPAYDLKTNKGVNDHSALTSFMHEINRLSGSAFKAYIETHFEVDTFLRHLAIGVLHGNPDDYRAMGNNYYFYHNPVTNKFIMIPYDYDHGLAQGWDASPVFSNWTVGANIYTWGNVNKHLLNTSQFAHPLSDKILSIPQYQIAYENHLKALIDPNNALFSFQAFNQTYMTQRNLYDNTLHVALMNQRFGLRNTEWYFNAKVQDVQHQLAFYHNNPSKRGT